MNNDFKNIFTDKEISKEDYNNLDEDLKGDFKCINPELGMPSFYGSKKEGGYKPLPPLPKRNYGKKDVGVIGTAIAGSNATITHVDGKSAEIEPVIDWSFKYFAAASDNVVGVNNDEIIVNDNEDKYSINTELYPNLYEWNQTSRKYERVVDTLASLITKNTNAKDEL